MKFFKRIVEDAIIDLIGKNKVILIMGTRRTGKTILVQEIKSRYQGESLLLNAEDFEIQELLKNRSIANYKK